MWTLKMVYGPQKNYKLFNSEYQAPTLCITFMSWAPNTTCGLRFAFLSSFRIVDYSPNKMILKEKYCDDSKWI